MGPCPPYRKSWIRPWKSIEMMPGRIGRIRIGWKSIEMMPGPIGVIGLQLPSQTVEFDRHLKPLTGIQCNLNGFRSVKLGGNPLRLHCMPAWSNWLNLVVELGGNPLRLCLVELVEFGG